MTGKNLFSRQVTNKGERIGYAPHLLPLLFLAPFVQVAWAEGRVQNGEQKAILRFAGQFGVRPGHPAFEKLLEWFDERPTEEFFDRSLEDLRELLASVSTREAARLRTLLKFGCVQTAHASGDIGFLRGRSAIRREEREIIGSIGERLGWSPAYL